MRKYDKAFKEEAVKLSDEIGVKQAAAQLGIPYYSRAEWRQKRKAFGDHAFVGSGIRRNAPLSENECRLIKENMELRKANEILKDALGLSVMKRCYYLLKKRPIKAVLLFICNFPLRMNPEHFIAL